MSEKKVIPAINLRIKRIRTEYLQESQAEFCKRIGYKQTGVASMELGSNVTERMIRSLLVACPEISEKWLRTGEGNMLLDMDSVEKRIKLHIDKLLKSDDEFSKRLILNYLELPKGKKDAIRQFLEETIK